MAYGGTGTGKTHTMEGPPAISIATLGPSLSSGDWSGNASNNQSNQDAQGVPRAPDNNPNTQDGQGHQQDTATTQQQRPLTSSELLGVVPRTIHRLFRKLAMMGLVTPSREDQSSSSSSAPPLQTSPVSVCVCVYELYCNKIVDLLQRAKRGAKPITSEPWPLSMDKLKDPSLEVTILEQGGVMELAGLSYAVAHSAQAAWNAVRAAVSCRSVAHMRKSHLTRTTFYCF